jgi:hypothetical protein
MPADSQAAGSSGSPRIPLKEWGRKWFNARRTPSVPRGSSPITRTRKSTELGLGIACPPSPNQGGQTRSFTSAWEAVGSALRPVRRTLPALGHRVRRAVARRCAVAARLAVARGALTDLGLWQGLGAYRVDRVHRQHYHRECSNANHVTPPHTRQPSSGGNRDCTSGTNNP